MTTPLLRAPAPNATCADIRTDSFALIEAELSAADASRISAHLLQCDACRSRCSADAVFLQRFRRALAIEPAPPSLAARIHQRLSAQPDDSGSA